MNPYFVALIVGLGLVGAIVLTVAAGDGRRAQPPIYTVAQVDAKLARRPEMWIGQTVWVRALAEPCPVWGSPNSDLHCATLQPDLIDPDGSDLAEPLPLVIGTNDSLLTFLRRLPFMNRLVPQAPIPPWEDHRTYLVRLRTVAKNHCGTITCAEAVLLGVQP